MIDNKSKYSNNSKLFVKINKKLKNSYNLILVAPSDMQLRYYNNNYIVP